MARPMQWIRAGPGNVRGVARGAEERVDNPLEGKADVYKGGNSLDSVAVLRMVQEVTLAALVG